MNIENNIIIYERANEYLKDNIEINSIKIDEKLDKMEFSNNGNLICYLIKKLN